MSAFGKNLVWLEEDGTQRCVRFLPAFHKCNDNPKEDYGIGGVKIYFCLREGDKAIDLEVLTNWGLPSNAFHKASPGCQKHRSGPARGDASGGMVTWHLPATEGPVCPALGTPCRFASSFTLGDGLFDLLRTEGDEALWKRMRKMLTSINKTTQET